MLVHQAPVWHIWLQNIPIWLGSSHQGRWIARFSNLPMWTSVESWPRFKWKAVCRSMALTGGCKSLFPSVEIYTPEQRNRISQRLRYVGVWYYTERCCQRNSTVSSFHLINSYPLPVLIIAKILYLAHHSRLAGVFVMVIKEKTDSNFGHWHNLGVYLLCDEYLASSEQLLSFVSLFLVGWWVKSPWGRRADRMKRHRGSEPQLLKLITQAR